MTLPASPWGQSLIEARVELFVAPSNLNASDRNAGTDPARPLATLGAALRALNALRAIGPNGAVAHLATGTYTWDVELSNIELAGAFAIVGDGAGQAADDGFTELLAPTSAIAGSGVSGITVTGPLGVDAFQGKTVEILTGAAVGDRRTIRNNTATVITPVESFRAAVAATDLFTILEPAVIVNIPTSDVLTAQNSYPALIRGVGVATGDLEPEGLELTADPSLLLSNIRFEVSGPDFISSFRVASSRVLTAGCEFIAPAGGKFLQLHVDSHSVFQAGIDSGGFGTTVDAFETPVRLGLTGNKRNWIGWGIFVDATIDNVDTIEMKRLDGFFVQRGVAVSLGDAFVICEGRWNLFGGAIIRTDQGTRERTGFLHVQNFGDCRLSPTSIGILIRGDHTDQGGAAICAVGGGYVLVGPKVDASIGPTAGMTLLASTKAYNAGGARGPIQAGRIDVGTKAGDLATLGGANFLLGASNGGVIVYNRSPTVGLPVPSIADIGVFTGTPNAAASATGTFLGAEGVLLTLVPGDGTIVRRGPV